LDNDGDALAAGMLYYNTTSTIMRIYSGSAWENVAVSTAGFATLTGVETLTNKTLTSPKINEDVAVTSTATELNLLDGVVGLVQADLTKLAAIDATAAEIDLLDGLSRGSIIYGNASAATTVLTKGTSAQVLTSDGTDISWSDPAGGGAEAGSVIIMPTSTVPTGYLECDGSVISRTTYSALFTILGSTYGSGDGSTTFNIPDLRGEFIRGWDNGRGQDSGRSIGTSQSDAFQGHYHSYRYYNQFLAGGGSKTDDMPQSPNSTSNNRVTTPISDGSNGTPRTANETRPKNIAMMYCIKY